MRVPGGYRVSGRFPFVSGCQHCEWVWLGCTVIENDVPTVDGNGAPETRQCLLRLSQCEILDTWHTTGLRGTGSNDVVVRDEFVEEEHSFSFQDPKLVRRSGPLDQLRILEAEGMRFLNKLVAYDDVIAACATEPGGVPRVQDLAL